jgi:TrmH family RNA methyltransferase
MGAIFSVAIARATGPQTLPGERIALVAGAGEPLHAPDQPVEVTLLVGAERDGLPQALLEACERVAHIPIRSQSLNAAMAATVALYEIARDRLAAEPER